MNRPNPATQQRLSRRQSQILTFIREHLLQYGYSPSIRQIGEAVDLSSSSTVHSHLRALEVKGYIRRKPNSVRAITLVEQLPPVDTSAALEVPCCFDPFNSSLTLEGGIHEGECVASVKGKMPGDEPGFGGVLLNPADAMQAGQWLVAWARNAARAVPADA